MITLCICLPALIQHTNIHRKYVFKIHNAANKKYKLQYQIKGSSFNTLEVTINAKCYTIKITIYTQIGYYCYHFIIGHSSKGYVFPVLALTRTRTRAYLTTCINTLLALKLLHLTLTEGL